MHVSMHAHMFIFMGASEFQLQAGSVPFPSTGSYVLTEGYEVQKIFIQYVANMNYSVNDK